MYLKEELQKKVLWFHGDGCFKFNCELYKNNNRVLLKINYNSAMRCYEAFIYYKEKYKRVMCYIGEPFDYIEIINIIVETVYDNIEEYFKKFEGQNTTTTYNSEELEELKKLKQIIEDIKLILFDYNTKKQTRNKLVEKLNRIYFTIYKEE